MATEHPEDLLFTGSIPELYEQILVPMIFQAYADDLAARVALLGPSAVLEVAAGTGVVTRALASLLPASAEIVATDLNPPMLAFAQTVGTSRPVTWRPAAAGDLPFADGFFDAVVCQFGVMFFPDRPRALAEMRRVLRPGGTMLFNVWDSLQSNEFPRVVNDAVAALHPDDPTTFMARRPHGYFDHDRIRADVAAGGFAATPTIETVEARSRAATAEMVAVGFCQGTPLRNEIERRHPGRLSEVTAVARNALTERFGSVDLEGRIRAHVITVRND